MLPKPQHLGPEYAAQFQDPAIVAAYHHRPPYPDEVFEILVSLLPESSRAVLDAGCGTGDIARRLAPLVDRVDAVDISAPMLEKGRQLPGGAHPHLNWICAPLEVVALHPAYGLITAGESLHWMDWTVVLPRFRDALVPGGYLAIVGREEQPSPWRDRLLELIRYYSTNRDFQPYNLVEELEMRGLFQQVGKRRTPTVPFTQSIESYVESIHSRNGFSRDRMPPAQAAAFDEEVRRLLADWCPDGLVELRIVGVVVWGVP